MDNPFFLILTTPNNKHLREFLVLGGYLLLGNPINKIKPWIIKTFSPISKAFKFPQITQLKYCQKLDFEADLINKIKPLKIKTSLFDFKIN